jgi:antirestriction protein ArdC
MNSNANAGTSSSIAPPTSGSASPEGAKTTVFDVVTQRILEALERGTVPWRKDWDAPGFQVPLNLASGKRYQGINFFILSLAGESFTSPYWLTFRQALERGGHVRKGEKGVPVFFWKVLDRTGEESQSGPDDDRSARRFVARYYTAFNVEQCDGIAYPKPEPTTRQIPPLETCDQVIAGYQGRPDIRHGGRGASYSPVGDVVSMPDRNAFHSPEGYYATLFHELIHSTGHPKRLARFTEDCPPPPFASPDYSREELVAELGAAFLCAEAGISNATLDNSASYLAGWLRVLRTDKRAIVFAASAARKAADLITGSTA